MNDLIQSSFDYAALPAATAMTARAAAERIKLRLKRTVEDIIEIGRELTEVKDKLPHGQFLPWIAAEFEMDQKTAFNFMSVSERFGNKLGIIPNFKPTILYALAAPSTPESVVEKAIEKAEAGEKVTVADVKDWKAELDAATQRCEEFRQESNERRKTIRTLEEQVDLLTTRDRAMQYRLEQAEQEINHLAQVVPEPEKVVVAPDDYEPAKAEAAKLRQQLADIEARKDQLVQQQVIAKLKEREHEIAALDHQAEQLKGTITSYQAHIAKVHLPELEMQQQLKAVEDFMRACAGLAASLALFEHAPNPATAAVWQKGIAAATDAAHAMRLHTDRRQELTVIRGEAA